MKKVSDQSREDQFLDLDTDQNHPENSQTMLIPTLNPFILDKVSHHPQGGSEWGPDGALKSTI